MSGLTSAATKIIAGLWQAETKREPDLETKEFRCVILTTTPNESVGRVHDRMPMMVQS
jgi:putative SOS response-associated peptidase YedK